MNRGAEFMLKSLPKHTTIILFHHLNHLRNSGE